MVTFPSDGLILTKIEQSCDRTHVHIHTRPLKNKRETRCSFDEISFFFFFLNVFGVAIKEEEGTIEPCNAVHGYINETENNGAY